MYKKKKIIVLGMVSSGVAVSKLLSKDNSILLTDIKCDDNKLMEELESLGVNVVIADKQAGLLNESFDYLIKNPGISLDNEVVVKAKELKIPVINEVEVAYNLLPKNVKIIAITGSNGKTTTTMITYEILKAAGLPVHMGGNIGIPVCDLVSTIKSGDILVLEISSHQLVDINKFNPDISVITNFSEVHLDMFKTYENYKNNKCKIFKNHSLLDKLILNGNDKEVVDITKPAPSEKIYFNSHGKGDIYIKNKKIIYHSEVICELSDIRLKGIHNYENVMCAILIAKQFNVSNDSIKEALNRFAGVEHRMEFVRRFENREFYNDSKATNNASTITALSAFDTPVILLLGGLDRGLPYDELAEHMKYVKAVVCYGETKDKIEEFCNRINVSVTKVDNLEEATKFAYNISEEGDTILLSPAHASWDQFKSFEERGEKFKEIINNLQ